ncbi:hypothetical protein [Altererythrobacter sp.]|uniref:hypothetical protein n=1 Tax=Altererythrobacter sp. TaxID=1872480 RepID=UPI003D081A7C
MSLTFLGRFIGFLMLAAIAALTGREYGLPIANYIAGARNSTAQDARFATRALVYRLPEQSPLSFTFSQPLTLFKLLIQPAVNADDHGRASGFVYGVKIHMYDATGAEVGAQEVYLHADSPDEVFASGEKWRFFRDRPEMVAGQDEILVESELPFVQADIEVLDEDQGVLGVDLRAYEQRPFLGSQAISAFLRRSKAEKRSLAAANAFPSDMLTQDEMTFLAANHWRPVGPTGIEGRDYQAFVLYEALLPAARRARR